MKLLLVGDASFRVSQPAIARSPYEPTPLECVHGSGIAKCVGRPSISRASQACSGRESGVVKAYVLIVTEPGETRRLVETIRKLSLVREVHEVMGPYDIVAEIEADSLQEIPGILQEEIRSLPGIQSTTSLVAFPA